MSKAYTDGSEAHEGYCKVIGLLIEEPHQWLEITRAKHTTIVVACFCPYVDIGGVVCMKGKRWDALNVRGLGAHGVLCGRKVSLDILLLLK